MSTPKSLKILIDFHRHLVQSWVDRVFNEKFNNSLIWKNGWLIPFWDILSVGWIEMQNIKKYEIIGSDICWDSSHTLSQ